MRDLFRVALVHLATVSLDKKFWHGRAKMIHAQCAFVQDTEHGFETRSLPAPCRGFTFYVADLLSSIHKLT